MADSGALKKKESFNPPLGVRLICYIYLLNAILYILSLLLFYSRIFVLGREANNIVSLSIKIIFILVPAYLFFRLARLKKDAWFLAVYFHTFFIINNSMAFLEDSSHLHSLVRVTGIYSSLTHSSLELTILALNSIVNLLILAYLLERKNYFFFKFET